MNDSDQGLCMQHVATHCGGSLGGLLPQGRRAAGRHITLWLEGQSAVGRGL